MECAARDICEIPEASWGYHGTQFINHSTPYLSTYDPRAEKCAESEFQNENRKNSCGMCQQHDATKIFMLRSEGEVLRGEGFISVAKQREEWLSTQIPKKTYSKRYTTKTRIICHTLEALALSYETAISLPDQSASGANVSGAHTKHIQSAELLRYHGRHVRYKVLKASNHKIIGEK